MKNFRKLVILIVMLLLCLGSAMPAYAVNAYDTSWFSLRSNLEESGGVTCWYAPEGGVIKALSFWGYCRDYKQPELYGKVGTSWVLYAKLRGSGWYDDAYIKCLYNGAVGCEGGYMSQFGSDSDSRQRLNSIIFPAEVTAIKLSSGYYTAYSLSFIAQVKRSAPTAEDVQAVGTKADAAKTAAQSAYNAANTASSYANQAYVAASGAKTSADAAKSVAEANSAKIDNLQNDVNLIKSSIVPEIQEIKGYLNATCTTGSTFKVVVNTSNADEFRVKADTGSWSSWVPVSSYATATGITGTGVHTISVEVRNSALGTTAAGQMTMFKV